MKLTQILESILLDNPHKAAVLSVGCASFSSTLFPSTQLSVNMLGYSTLWTASFFGNACLWLTLLVKGVNDCLVYKTFPFHNQGVRSSYSGLSCPYSRPTGGKRQLSCMFSEGSQEAESASASYHPYIWPALKGPPFELLQSTNLWSLSLKTALLLALASVKRVGDLQMLSISLVCLEFWPNDSNPETKAWLCTQGTFNPVQSSGHHTLRDSSFRGGPGDILVMPCQSFENLLWAFFLL